jgi:hypothetical protein
MWRRPVLVAGSAVRGVGGWRGVAAEAVAGAVENGWGSMQVT